MSTDIYSPEIATLIKKFNSQTEKLYKQVENEFQEYVNNKDGKMLLSCLKQKYKYLSRFNISKRTKLSKCRAYIYELFMIDIFKNEFTEDEIEQIYKYVIFKITGLYKHAQALKTGYCNREIINAFSEKNTISVCITKNSLEANEQWLIRLFKELDSRYPHHKLNDKIMIISSKKNTLDGNATHCKNIHDAWSNLKQENKFKIIFICSNKTRIQDVYEMALSFLNLKPELVKNLRILHDEAHNDKEGIPPYRHIIENILCLDNVLNYMPITASIGNVVCDENPLWKKENLERYATNFTDFDTTKSNDPNYSSISDAKKIIFEGLHASPEWKDYQVDSVSRENFIKIDDKYKDKKITDLSEKDFEDIDNRRKLEFCQFMKNDKEIEALNNGLNVLNINVMMPGNLFKKNCLNIHVISTPRRNIITYKLCEFALKQEYEPIVLGIYGSEGKKYHLYIDGTEKCVDDIMGHGEFNEKLYKLIEHLKTANYKTERAFIIIGNYNPTGESLSFVNYKYGTVRSVTRLISTNAEENYQAAARLNYMLTKFLESDPNWTPPTKYLIGEYSFISDALSYEQENDARIDNLIALNDNENLTEPNLPSRETITNKNGNGTTAIPIEINVDRDDKNYNRLIEIANKSRRTDDEKSEFLKLLENSVKTPESEFEIDDKSGKFNWDNMTIKDFRCYRNKEDTETTKGYWKFKNYQTHSRTLTPFINNTSNHVRGQCEILVCLDTYIIQDKNSGEVLEKNHKNKWWIGYKY